jgi:ubiquitin carboxyl-terminal hydrolase L5
LTPFQRGEAFASFDFVKKIHNSFAKKMDLLENDRYLSIKVNRAQREKRERMEEARTPKKGKNVKQAEKSGNRRSTRRQSAESAVSDDSAEGYEESAHHFIAFVPVGNEVWKLDGYDSQPTSVGAFASETGETWFSSVSDTIAALMAAGDDDYGVIALTQSPLFSLRKKACLTINTVEHIESRLDTLDPNWKSFIDATDQPPSPRMLGLSEHLLSHPLPDSIKARIDMESVADLIDRRGLLTQELGRLAAGIMTEIQNEAEEDQRAAQRRYDCGPVIKKWLEMLAENGYLEKHLDRFMPTTGKKAAVK